MRVKMSKQPPPAPTASAIGPCPTVIKIVGRPGTGSLPGTIAPPDHPLLLRASKTGLVLRASGSIEGDGLSMAGLVLQASVVLKVTIFLWRALCFELQVVPRRLFCFGSLVILDVARCYLWLFTLYINIKIGKNSC